jgi:predicted MPP superfamily phosphohydrolase
MVCAVCGAGFLWLVFVMLRGLLLRGPRALESSHSFLYDVRQELGRRPAGLGPYAVLTRVPLNEQFTIQMDEKTLRLPGLPAVWDGLTILHLSDWHFTGTVTREYFERAADLASALPADLACFTGDLIDNIALLDWLPKTLGRVQGTLGSFFILGNHDWYHDVPKIRRSLEELGWRDVGGRCETLAMHGQTLAIAGDETPWMGQHPAFPGDAAFRLLLSHTPDNIRWAQSRQVDLMLSGHTHGGQVRLPVIGPVYSPSKYGCKYASGTFWEPPTLMHVSRGLSGQHPLRWRCRPEITRVVLKSG